MTGRIRAATEAAVELERRTLLTDASPPFSHHLNIQNPRLPNIAQVGLLLGLALPHVLGARSERLGRRGEPPECGSDGRR